MTQTITAKDLTSIYLPSAAQYLNDHNSGIGGAVGWIIKHEEQLDRGELEDEWTAKLRVLDTEVAHARKAVKDARSAVRALDEIITIRGGMERDISEALFDADELLSCLIYEGWNWELFPKSLINTRQKLNELSTRLRRLATVVYDSGEKKSEGGVLVDSGKAGAATETKPNPRKRRKRRKQSSTVREPRPVDFETWLKRGKNELSYAEVGEVMDCAASTALERCRKVGKWMKETGATGSSVRAKISTDSRGTLAGAVKPR